MDAIEKAIRGAFERGDPEDPVYRAKVYRSVGAALEKAILANAAMTPDVAERRRAGLRDTIESVESEFRPAGPPLPADEPEDAQAPIEEDPDPDAEWHGVAPKVPSIDDFDSTPRLESAEIREPLAPLRPARRRRPLTLAFVLVTLLAVAGIGGWFAVDTGFLKSAAERDTSVPNPPQTLPAEAFQPAPDAAQAPAAALQPDRSANWTTVFSPADPTTARAPAEGSAEIVQSGDRPAMRIRSDNAGSAVLFDVGQGVLERLRGKKAIFDITARSEEGKPTQMSVSCDFGALGDCGRKRYAVGVDPGDFLFEIDVPLAAPVTAGTVAISPDVDNAGKAVEILAIRVSAPGN